MQGGKHLRKAVLKSQQTFCDACPDLFYCSLWKSPISAKAKPVAKEFTIHAENVVCYPSTSHCLCAVLWDNSYFWISANLHSYPEIPDAFTISTCYYCSTVVKCAVNKENTFPFSVLSSGLSSYLLIDKYGKIVLFFHIDIQIHPIPSILHSSQDRELSVLLQKQSGKCGLWCLTISLDKSEFLRLFRLVF